MQLVTTTFGDHKQKIRWNKLKFTDKSGKEYLLLSSCRQDVGCGKFDLLLTKHTKADNPTLAACDFHLELPLTDDLRVPIARHSLATALARHL